MIARAWIDHTPSKWFEGKLVSVQKIGDFWNWKKFRKEPVRFILFTEKGIYEYAEEKDGERKVKS